MLAIDTTGDRQDTTGLSTEVMMPIAGRGTKDYGDWWRDQFIGQDDLSVFSVRLLGNASSPQLFTPMAHNDLAYCR